MQTGRLRRPSDSMRSRAFGRRHEVNAVGAVDAGGDGLDLLLQRLSSGYRKRKSSAPSGRSPGDRPDGPGQILRARAAVGEVVATTASGAGRQRDLAHAAISDLSSVGKALMATTAGTPYWRTISMCLARFSAPRRTASGFSALSAASSGLPATTCPRRRASSARGWWPR